MVSFDGAGVKVLTLVYAIVDGKVLMLERAATKAFLPGWFVAPGGKVEPGEDVVASGLREFWEETGMTLQGARLRGSYTYMTDTASNHCGVIYFVVGDAVEGEFKTDVADGTLHWLTLDEVLAHRHVMEDHKVWMKALMTSPDHFACVGSWKKPADGGANVGEEWADSRGYFETMAAKAA